MRILIVGNDPHIVAGVPNYTRPMANTFAELGHRVFYFYSGVTGNRYNWFIKPYLRYNRKDFPFECAEVINSPNWLFNYDNPLIDIHSPSIERLFTKYLDKVQPDVMHIHSRLGLSASLIEIASKRGIGVFNSIHVYGMLCQKRVMVGRDGEPCHGPHDLNVCAMCGEGESVKKLKLRARLKNIHPELPRLLLKIRSKIVPRTSRIAVEHVETVTDGENPERLNVLKTRLKHMVGLMNEHIVQNICVSTDVKLTLQKFGVSEDKLLVQHIGSLVAEKQREFPHDLHNPIVFGNIGGVAYYKGTHVLVDAVSKVKNKNFVVKIFGKYDPRYREKIMTDKHDLPIEYYGRYNLDELQEILDEIDVMILPSICQDTAPQTIFESFSARIPTIASDIGGFPDFVKDGVNGCLFKQGDSQDLAYKIENLLAEPEKIKTFAKNIPRLKTIQQNANELIRLYRAHKKGT